jgi:two-component system, LytTR family, sensor kinase
MFGIRFRYLFIVLLTAYSYLNIVYTVGNKLFDFYIPQYFLFSVLALVVLGIWELNRLVENNLLRLALLFRKKIHPLIIQFILSLVNVLIVCVASIELLYPLLDMPLQLNAQHLTLLTAFGFRINLFLNCANAIVFFMNKLKKTQMEAEQLKKISIEAQFEALRNQINPHFLFNCFNVLSTLVYKDADTSATFISRLSNVYRYLLYNQEKKVVRLKEELDFIESYLFLLKIRFQENITITNTINTDTEKFYVAPAVLQMLMENAIKHNVVSKKNPLHIALSSQDNFFVVSNNLQEKNIKEESTQLGLKNIQSRYRLLSDIPVHIEKTIDKFIVKIPLIQIEVI